MLHQNYEKQPFSIPPLKSGLNPILHQQSYQQNCRNICNTLLSLTRSKSLSKALSLHAYIIKFGIQTAPLISHHLINFYSKSQLPLFSRQVFDETPYRSSTTWSSIISAFAQNELPLLALDHFRKMRENGVVPDERIFPSATKSCAILSRCDVGKSFHSLAVRSGYADDVFVGSSLVDMYAKCGEIGDARKVFDELPDKNVVCWTGMICGYTQLGENEEALKLFKCALLENLDVNDFTFTSVVRVCGNATLLELGRQLHALCLKMSYDSSSFVGSSLISMYSKCGVIESAHRVFPEVPIKNLGIWNSMMIACAQHGQTDDVFDLFKEMESVKTRPNFITFLCVLYACSHAGLVEEGQFYFKLMKSYGIEPGPQHYATLVDLLGRAGKLQEAVSIIEEMPIPPTESVWGALLTGCRIHKNTDLAVYAADKVFELSEVSPGMHVLLSNAYAAAGKYEEAAKARKTLRDRGVKKETGLSWVEEGNQVHTFTSMDRSHPKTKQIFEKLEELSEELERAGYVADISHVLREVDHDEKNMTIRYHSERIAIAFGLISFPTYRPIRVMKNLRVCGDCHNAIKFMSKCTGRVIIVRDNNRFHRFEDGKCSCNDYW